VAQQFNGQAQAAQVALIDGAPGGVWAAGGVPRVAFGFTIRDGKVAEIELIADPVRLSQMEIEIP
jgi:RNA polymerase sigma-70 factor (ECF subfamily)